MYTRIQGGTNHIFIHLAIAVSLIIFILFVMIIKLLVSKCSLLSHFICLRACKIYVVFVETKPESSSRKFLRRSLLIFIIKVFRTIVFIFIVISTTFRPICPPAFFRCLSNSGTFTELRTTSFIETTGVACSNSVSHNRVQVLTIPVYYDD